MENNYKLLRKTLKLSQREFGEKLGVSRDVISNIEYGRVLPKELLIRLICQQYNVNSLWLETGKGEMFAGDFKKERKLAEALEIFKTLRPEFRDYALEQIRKLAELQDKK